MSCEKGLLILFQFPTVSDHFDPLQLAIFSKLTSVQHYLNELIFLKASSNFTNNK